MQGHDLTNFLHGAGANDPIPSLVAFEDDRHAVLMKISFVLFLVTVCLGVVAWLSWMTCRIDRGKAPRESRVIIRRRAPPQRFTKSYASIETDVETSASTPHSLSPS